MRRETDVIVLAFFGGLFVWLVHGVVDFLLFNPGMGFWEILITALPTHELSMRLTNLVCFWGLGLVMALIVGRRRLAEEALQESERRLRGIAEASADYLITTDLGLRVQFINRTEPGLRVGDVVGTPLWALVEEADQPRVKEILQDVASTGGQRRYETEYTRPDGTIVHFESIAVPLRHDRRIVGLTVVARDVSDRRRTEEAAQESEERFRTVFDHAPIGIDVVAEGGQPLEVNRALQETLGYTEDELRSMAFTDFTHPDDVEASLRLVRQLAEGESDQAQMEKRYLRKDGRLVWAQTSVSAVRDEDGKALYFIAMVVDITERRQTLLELKRSQHELRALTRRLTRVQESERRNLAKELHDRVGSEVASLGITLKVVRDRLAPGDHEEEAQRLDDAVGLVERILERSRDLMSELHPMELDDYGVMAALRLYCDRFSRRTGLAIDVGGIDTLPRLPGEVETALYRIAQEALINAAKHAGASRVEVTMEPAGAAVRLTIADDGAGFDLSAETRTADDRGWGMITMRERALAVGGELRVESAPGKGTRVVVEVAPDG